MKTTPEPPDDTLLTAVLADEDWQALSGALRDDALASLRAGRRSRQLMFRTLLVAAVFVVLVGAGLGLLDRNHPAARAAALPAARAPRLAVRDFTDDELLALFPEGSCLIADIDGQHRLIVLDESKIAAQGVTVQ